MQSQLQRALTLFSSQAPKSTTETCSHYGYFTRRRFQFCTLIRYFLEQIKRRAGDNLGATYSEPISSPSIVLFDRQEGEPSDAHCSLLPVVRLSVEEGEAYYAGFRILRESHMIFDKSVAFGLFCPLLRLYKSVFENL